MKFGHGPATVTGEEILSRTGSQDTCFEVSCLEDKGGGGIRFFLFGAGKR